MNIIVCAGESETFWFAEPIGIGLVNSAINLTRILIENGDINHILFVGTAGSYGRNKIFDIVESKTAANIEHGFFDAKSYTPIDNVISSSDDVSRETVVNSSNYITTNKDIAERFLEAGLDLENMEFFSVMTVAKSFNIPAGGVFAVSNYCDKNAHEEFLENRKRAMNILEEHLRSKKII